MLTLVWQINVFQTVAQAQRRKSVANKTSHNSTISPLDVWENFVSAIERKDVKLLQSTFSKGMKNGGWLKGILFSMRLLSINPAKRGYKITRDEDDVYKHKATLKISRSNSEQTFYVDFIKEPDGWKLATEAERMAAENNRIDFLELETVIEPISRFRKGIAVVVAPKPAIKIEPPIYLQANPPQLSNKLIPALCRNQLVFSKNKSAVTISLDFSTPAATVKTLVSTIQCRQFELSNQAYSNKYQKYTNSSLTGNAAILFLSLSAHLYRIVQDTGEIGVEYIRDDKAKLAIKSFSSDNWYWLNLVKENNEWKVDLDVELILKKALSPTTNPDELIFQLLDFAEQTEK